MKKAPIVLNAIAAAGLLLGASVSLRAQTSEPQQAPSDTVQLQPQMNQVEQMLGPLNITSDQAVQIRRIYREQHDERQAANFRLRLSQRALTEAIQSPTPDEALIGQRSKELADAQANTIRIRSLTEARVLQVLTPEQRTTLRIMRAQANQRRNQQNNPRAQRRGGNALQPNQNQNRPALTPKQQQRLLKQPQQQRPK